MTQKTQNGESMELDGVGHFLLWKFAFRVSVVLFTLHWLVVDHSKWWMSLKVDKYDMPGSWATYIVNSSQLDTTFSEFLQPEREKKIRKEKLDCFAEAQLATKLALNGIGSGDLGPIFVGGIGDSGTRGVRILLSKLGVDLGYRNFPGIPNSISKSSDSYLFMERKKIRRCDVDGGGTKAVSPSWVYNRILRNSHGLSYDRQTIQNDTVWFGGIQFVAKLALTVQQKHEHNLRIDDSLIPGYYGVKHPRTSLLLPLYKAAFGKKFKYVHVIRDGRDIAHASTQAMFREICQNYFGSACKRSDEKKLEFWAALNLELYEWAMANLGPEQYFLFRIEDLADGKTDCIGRLAHFLNLNSSFVETRLTEEVLRTTFLSHQISYSGRKWDPVASTKCTQAGLSTPIVVKAFQTFGYSLDDRIPWPRNKTCLEL